MSVDSKRIVVEKKSLEDMRLYKNVEGRIRGHIPEGIIELTPQDQDLTAGLSMWTLVAPAPQDAEC